MKHLKIMSLLLMLMVSLQASIEQVMNQSGIEWVKKSTPNYTYTVKEEMKKSHGKVIEPSVDIKYAKNKLNSGINRTVTTIEPVEHEYKIITETWNDKNGSYLTWENAVLGAAMLGAIGAWVTGVYAYNEYNRLSSDLDTLSQDLKVANDDLSDYEHNREIEVATQKTINLIKKALMNTMQVKNNDAKNIKSPSQAHVDSLNKEKQQEIAADVYTLHEIMKEVESNPNYTKERNVKFKEKLAARDKAREDKIRAKFAAKNKEGEDKTRAGLAAKNNSAS